VAHAALRLGHLAPGPRRERSLLDDLNMTDRKIDDKITKEWIGLIRGQ